MDICSSDTSSPNERKYIHTQSITVSMATHPYTHAHTRKHEYIVCLDFYNATSKCIHIHCVLLAIWACQIVTKRPLLKESFLGVPCTLLFCSLLGILGVPRRFALLKRSFLGVPCTPMFCTLFGYPWRPTPASFSLHHLCCYLFLFIYLLRRPTPSTCDDRVPKTSRPFGLSPFESHLARAILPMPCSIPYVGRTLLLPLAAPCC